MKLKKLYNLRSKLIKIGLIKSKIYKNYYDQYILKDYLDKLEVHLKNALMVIFKYHANNKKILFLGVDKFLLKRHNSMLKKTNHLFLPESYWVRGLLTNRVTLFKYIKKKINMFVSDEVQIKQIKDSFRLRKKPHLIVMLNKSSQTLITKEAIKLKIPLVILESDISGNSSYLNEKKKIIVSLVINSILKTF